MQSVVPVFGASCYPPAPPAWVAKRKRPKKDGFGARIKPATTSISERDRRPASRALQEQNHAILGDRSCTLKQALDLCATRLSLCVLHYEGRRKAPSATRTRRICVALFLVPPLSTTGFFFLLRHGIHLILARHSSFFFFSISESPFSAKPSQ